MASNATSSKEHRPRTSIHLEMKLKVLDALADGESVAKVGRIFKINESTVRTIKKNEFSIRNAAAQGTVYATKSSSYTRDVLMVKMEKALFMWIEDHAQKNIPLDGELIRAKAMELYLSMQQNEPSTSRKKDFNASKGWFYNFIRSNSIRNVKIKGESASADVTAATEFPAKLAEIIEEGAYHADQVYNADETGLYWKRMPSRTYISKQERCASGFKAAKDRVTLLFCSNASGDHMLKPLLINRAMCPRSLKGRDFSQLPVHWMANHKAWVTKSIFQEWFEEMFIPEVKAYLEEKGLDFHVLLLVDNAPGHPILKHPNVQVVFLPPNTTSLIQPLDQGIIASFKKHYIKQSFRYILSKLDEDQSMTVTQAWKDFKIRDALEFIAKALSAMKPRTLNACWKPLWPACVKPGSSGPSNEVDSEILILAHAIGGEGFEDMDTNDVGELLADTIIEDDELIHGLNILDLESAEDVGDKEIDPSHIEEGNKFATNLAEHFMKTDPCVERAVSFRSDLNLCMYRYNRVTEQTNIPDSHVEVPQPQSSTVNEDVGNTNDAESTNEEDFNPPSNHKRFRVISTAEEGLNPPSKRHRSRVLSTNQEDLSATSKRKRSREIYADEEDLSAPSKRKRSHVNNLNISLVSLSICRYVDMYVC